MDRIAAVLAVLTLTPWSGAEGKKPRKPHLELQARGRALMIGATTLVAATLSDVEGEEYSCPELEWSWGDQSTGTSGGDCPAFEPGHVIPRRFTAEHVYESPGAFTIELVLRHAGKDPVRASTTVKVGKPLKVEAGCWDRPCPRNDPWPR